MNDVKKLYFNSRRKVTMSNNNNRQVVPEAKAALNQMKLEIVT